MRRAVPAFVGARGSDSVQALTADRAKALHNVERFDFAIRYLGSVTSEEISTILAAGLAFMPVTFGIKHGIPLTPALGAQFGASSARQAVGIGIPQETTVWLDLEDCTGSAADVIAFVNAWVSPIKAAGYMPGLYVGAGAVLNSAELYALGVVRYWQSLSKEIDARGALAEPACGWCMIQLFDSVTRGGAWVDVDVIQKDYRGRLPMWCVEGTP